MPSARSARSGGFSAFERLQRPAAAAAEPPSAEPSAVQANGAAPGGGSPTRAAAKPPPPERELALAEVQRLLEDLRTAVVGLAFQKALDSVRSKDWGALKKRAGVAKLLSYAWKAPLKASGFAVDGYSFPRVLAAVRAHAAQPGIRSLSEEVERLLKFFPGALFGSNAGRMKGSATNSAMSQSPGGRGAFSKLSTGSNGRSDPAPAPTPSARPSMLRGRPMGLGEAKDILKRLKEEASRKAFQDGLAEIGRSGGPEAQKVASHFVAKYWAEAMSFYEFPVTPAGFKEMADGIMRCAYNRHVEMLAHEVEEKLHVPLGSFFGIASENGDEGEDEPVQSGGHGAVRRPDEVSVLLRHNAEGTELRVPVTKDASFWDLKEAAARILGRDTIKTRGRLVRKSPGGTFVSYKDSDPVGGVREVLVLGAELTPENGGKAAQAPAAGPPSSGKKASMRLSLDDMTPVMPQAAPKPDPQRVPQLTREQARQLLAELHAGYKDTEFQRRLLQFHATLGTTSQFSKERQRLALTVQTAVLPRYGFRASLDGASDMQKALGPLVLGDKDMERLALECDDLLLVSARVKKKSKADAVEAQPNTTKEKAQPEPEEPPKAPATDPEPEPPSRPEARKPTAPAKEVYFVVRHALNEKDEEVWLKAMSSATFLQIKHVLADKLGRDEVVAKARFVHKSNSAGVWTDFGDEEEIGRDRTVVHLMGISLPAKEIALMVRHAIQEESYEVKLQIWTNWKFREVKEELARKLGRPEIIKKGKFVFRPSGNNAQGAWAAFKDEEQVGGRSELRVIGVDDLQPTEEARKAMQEEAKQKRKAKEEEAASRAEAAKKAMEDVESKARAEAERKAKEKKDRKIKQAAEEWKAQASQEAEESAMQKDAGTKAPKAGDEAEAKANEARRESYRNAKEEAERREREALERKAKQAQEEAEQKAKQETARQAKEEAERMKREEAELNANEAERRDREAKDEAERREREEAEQRAKEEAERQRREEAERSAKEEAERRAKEAKEEAEKEAERQKREESERRAKEEADRREKEEAERRAKEEAERIAVERKVKEEAERRAKAAQEEAERKAKEEAERRVKEEAEREAREQAERREKEEAERKAREEEERREREEAERKAREETERQEREARELLAKEREEAERKAKQEEERKAKEAERKAKEEADKKAKAEKDQKAKREAEQKAKEEIERKTKEAEQKAKAAASLKMKQELANVPQKRLPQLDVVRAMGKPGVEDQPRMDEEATVWLVIGGEDKGGILVRKGEGYDSKPLPFRLATGTRVEEVERAGNRLHYRRLVGDGPDFGWVNVTLNEKVLLEPYKLKNLYGSGTSIP